MTDGLACPTCGKTVALTPPGRPASFPFCCTRCRDRDFGRWIDGGYVVAGPSVDELPLEDLRADEPRPAPRGDRQTSRSADRRR